MTTVTRTARLAFVAAFAALDAARAQTATVTGQVVLRDGGEPLGYTTVAVSGTQRLTSESGTFSLGGLPPGPVRLQFKRIGFAPVDTTLTVAANETARVRIAMTRLVLRLAEVVVNGACTDRTPFEPKSPIVAELFDQITQNAERLRLLARERPFTFTAVGVNTFRGRDGTVVRAVGVDTVERGPLAPVPYAPRRVVFRFRHASTGKDAWGVNSPELSDLADTAFTNNHCLWYAGQERLGADSVIRVDFRPVPWLAKEADLEGSIYLRADGYRLVGLFTRLNRMPKSFGSMREYTNRAWFRELVDGIPMLAGWELTNVFPNDRPRFVQTGEVTGVRWLDAPPPRSP